jgi:hypothetical protein
MSMTTSALRRHNRALELAIKLATLELRFELGAEKECPPIYPADPSE